MSASSPSRGGQRAKSNDQKSFWEHDDAKKAKETSFNTSLILDDIQQ